MVFTKERVQKVISERGYCSRRAAEQLIKEGRVTINGRAASLGDRADPAADVVSIDGRELAPQKHRRMLYYMLYKPRGYVTTLSDRHAGKTVGDIIESMAEIGERVYPVGRLDKDSEGLLILTNDGGLTNAMTHPSGRVRKLYRVTVRSCPDESQLVALSSGVVLDDGYRTAPMPIRVISDGDGRAVLEMSLAEGKNRQIRRMCGAVGLEVARLKRVAIGPLNLGSMRPGDCRELRKEELAAIRKALPV